MSQLHVGASSLTSQLEFIRQFETIQKTPLRVRPHHLSPNLSNHSRIAARRHEPPTEVAPNQAHPHLSAIGPLHQYKHENLT